MKYIFTILFLFILSSFQAQDFGVKKKDSCYLNYDSKGEVIKKQTRYAEWECGKLVGVLDCNSDLSYDESTDIVSKRETDRANLDGVGKPYTGKCEMCHQNGTLQRRVTFVNGKENGIDTSFYASGCRQVIRASVQGVENGTWYYYFDSTAILAWEMNYSVGEKHGRQIYFDKYGDTIKLEHYQNGIPHGEKRIYYDSSKIKRVVNYQFGLFDGPFTVYEYSGVVIEELNYSKGKKDGVFKYYYNDGELLRTESWVMGVKNGEFKTFFYGGEIQISENYKKGLKEGWFEVYYHNKRLKNRALYKKNTLLEEHRFDEHGRETYTFGGEESSDAEDDEMPGKKKRKKKKRKKKK